MNTVIVNHWIEDRTYELTMVDIPTDPETFFNEVIVEGFENWIWTGKRRSPKKKLSIL